eukprot:Hpha_TRINITY_DN6136_c0_g2::TRINITY_DN6136_c0_g2_i1::g.164841::m.164841
MSGLLLFVNVDGSRIPVELDPGATVEDLQKEVVTANPSCKHRGLLFQGEPLVDPGAYLADLGVCPQSELFLSTESLQWISGALKLRGKNVIEQEFEDGKVPEQLLGDEGKELIKYDEDGSLQLLCPNGDIWAQTSGRLPPEGEYLSPVMTTEVYKNMMWLIVSTEQSNDDNAFGYHDGEIHDEEAKKFLVFINIITDSLYWRGSGHPEECHPMSGCASDGMSYRFRVTAENDIILVSRDAEGKIVQLDDWQCKSRSSFKKVVDKFTPEERSRVSFGVAARTATDGVWKISHDWPRN